MIRNPAKRKALIFLGLTFGALLLLAAGLSSIPFEGVRHFTFRPPAAQGPGGALDRAAAQRLQIIFYMFLILYLLVILSLFLTREGRVRLMAFIVLFTVVSLCVYAVGSLLTEEEPPPGPAVARTSELLPEEPGVETTVEVIPLDEMPLPSTPSWLVTLVGVILPAALVGAVLGLLWLILRRRRAHSLPEALAEHAQEAVDALEAGGDLSNVIIRCYAQMSKVLFDERSLMRHTAMTPREFEQMLLRVGLPAEPVHTLTRLFEEVRYGGISPDSASVEQALESLRAIVAHCQALKEAEKKTE